MPEFHCPSCQAAIEPDLIESTGRAECPFCQADLSGLGLPEPAVDLAASLPADDAAASDEPLSAPLTRPLAEPPAKSRIRIVESTPERLVLYIPGGGKQARALGCFAFCWIGFMCLFTPPW